MACDLLGAGNWMESSTHRESYLYTEATNHQQDMELAQEIRTRIDELNIDDQSEVSLVFLNYHKSACNKDCYTSDQLGLVGRSLFEVTVSPNKERLLRRIS